MSRQSVRRRPRVRPGFRRLIALAAFVLLVAVLLHLKAGADAQLAIPESAVRLDVGSAAAGRPLPRAFIGFSVEYPSVIAYSGENPARPNRVFLRLVRGVAPGQSPVIRIGGDTTDWTWWTTRGVAKPAGIRYTLNRRWMEVTRATAHALDAHLILGINLESDRKAIAGSEAAALVRGIGRRYIAGFELGNEPEVYGSLGWYTTSAGVGIPGRPASYWFGSYLRDYANVSAALPHSVPLVGPASGAPPWLGGLRHYLQSEPRVRLATFHSYHLNRCSTVRGAPGYPTISHLLSPLASSAPAAGLRRAVEVAHARGLALRADELNSVACGGVRGVSDTFASALWILNTLFHLDAVGVDGVNIHTFQKAIYEPFAFGRASGRWYAQVKPLYYGLLMFARAAPPGSRLLATSFRGPHTLHCWATRGPDGRIRIVLINDSRRRPATVAVRVPGPSEAVTEQRLSASRADAKGGVRLGGQSFGGVTTSGELTGARQLVALRSVQHRYLVRLSPASAVLQTVYTSAVSPPASRRDVP